MYLPVARRLGAGRRARVVDAALSQHPSVVRVIAAQLSDRALELACVARRELVPGVGMHADCIRQRKGVLADRPPILLPVFDQSWRDDARAWIGLAQCLDCL